MTDQVPMIEDDEGKRILAFLSAAEAYFEGCLLSALLAQAKGVRVDFIWERLPGVLALHSSEELKRFRLELERRYEVGAPLIRYEPSVAIMRAYPRASSDLQPHYEWMPRPNNVDATFRAQHDWAGQTDADDLDGDDWEEYFAGVELLE